MPLEMNYQDFQQTNQVQFIEKVKELLAGRYEQMPAAFVHSFGCQQNVSDGERIKGILAQMGYGFVDAAEKADLVLFNTCAVRGNAEDRVFGNIGQLVHCKRRNPEMIIAVCGCMTQQEHITQKIKKSYPYVDLVFGTHGLQNLPQMICKVLEDHKRVFDISEQENIIMEGLPVYRENVRKVSIPIMYGCDNFCSYCIVPYVRGRERSRKPEAVLQEAKQLIKAGCREILLLGQNVNSYGKGLEESINFAGLLRQLNELEGDFWIRFMTSHPKDCTIELLDTIAECEKVCNHLHLPVQSGCDRILREMNRHYTREQYLGLVRYAKEKIPGLMLTSDIIVGFPRETYEEFLETLSLLREVKYASLFTFIYSPRQGTKAAEMSDPIPYEEKNRWFREMLDVQTAIGEQGYQELVGKTFRVLADGIGKTADGYISGRTEQNVIVEFPGERWMIGEFINVRVTKAFRWAVLGEVI